MVCLRRRASARRPPLRGNRPGARCVRWSASVNQAIEELVGRISRGLMVRVGGVDNAALMGNFAYDMLRVL